MNDVFPSSPGEQRRSLIGRWQAIPLYLRIVVALLIGLVVGFGLRELQAAVDHDDVSRKIDAIAAGLNLCSKLVLRLLSALAPPLILTAVVKALMQAHIPRQKGARLVYLLVLNTTVAILIGLSVANLLKPGRWSPARPQAANAAVEKPAADSESAPPNPILQFLDNVPQSILGPLGDGGQVLGVIFLAVAFGIALRRLRHHQVSNVEDLVGIAFEALLIVLHWVIEVIPLAVFGIVASTLYSKGVGDFIALGGFVLAVLVALLLQASYYLLRIRFFSWVRPRDAVRGTRDALVMAFSTASSTATMPVTYACLRENVGVREQSASLGSLIGANFNNDGTALYEAMSALFVSQLVGLRLSLQQQLLVVLTSIVASVGAAGIPEAGLVTMTLVFDAVGLHDHKSYILVLLTVDWFLDRCRTAINVMGDVNVSCLLDGREREMPTTPPPKSAELSALIDS